MKETHTDRHDDRKCPATHSVSATIVAQQIDSFFIRTACALEDRRRGQEKETDAADVTSRPPVDVYVVRKQASNEGQKA